MSNNVLGKQPESRALRILEALSGVDEELLERSESGAAQAQAGAPRFTVVGKNLRKPLWQYGRAWAAVMCLAAVGVMTWGGVWLMGGVTEDSASNEAIYTSIAPESFMVQDAEEAVDNMQPEASGSVADSMGGKTEDLSKEQTQNSQNAQNSQYSGSEMITEESDKLLADVEITTVPRLEAEKFTEAEARGVEVLGKYVPDKLPAGYGFESAYYSENTGNPSLSVCWTRGMDYIMLSIQVEAESVGTVDNPVFAREDLDLEVIEKRMISRVDAGDTDTPRGTFAVLYPDGILVSFNGRGTAEEIWEMFCSVEENIKKD